MVTIESFRQLALAFPNATEQPHFEKISFRINNKIFATLDTIKERACVKLNAIDQSVFCAVDKTIIYPVNNKWGKQGWTMVELSGIKKGLLKDILETSFNEIAPKKTNKNKLNEKGNRNKG